jgi:hypothetical protein
MPGNVSDAHFIDSVPPSRRLSLCQTYVRASAHASEVRNLHPDWQCAMLSECTHCYYCRVGSPACREEYVTYSHLVLRASSVCARLQCGVYGFIRAWLSGAWGWGFQDVQQGSVMLENLYSDVSMSSNISEDEIYRMDSQQAFALPQAPSHTGSLAGITVRLLLSLIYIWTVTEGLIVLSLTLTRCAAPRPPEPLTWKLESPRGLSRIGVRQRGCMRI